MHRIPAVYEKAPTNGAGNCQTDSGAMLVMYESRMSGLKWNALFDLGTEEENANAALDLAWKRNARILARSEPKPEVSETI